VLLIATDIVVVVTVVVEIGVAGGEEAGK